MRILAIRPGGIGDLIVSLPALECLRNGWLEVWTRRANAPLIRFADRVQVIESTGLDLLGVMEPQATLVDELRSFDRIVSWYGAKRPDFIELVLGLGLPFEFLAALPAEGCGCPAVDFYLRQMRSLGVACPAPGEAIPRIPCTGPAGDYAVIHPFSGSPRKNWPLEKFRRFARGLERITTVRWCAGPDDPPLPEAVRMDDLYDLACWLAGARLYVGNDSGITHLAAAAGAPVLALFGPTDPLIWAPRGPNVRVACWTPRDP